MGCPAGRCGVRPLDLLKVVQLSRTSSTTFGGIHDSGTSPLWHQGLLGPEVPCQRAGGKPYLPDRDPIPSAASAIPGITVPAPGRRAAGKCPRSTLGARDALPPSAAQSIIRGSFAHTPPLAGYRGT
jgi:hypothetical protein